MQWYHSDIATSLGTPRSRFSILFRYVLIVANRTLCNSPQWRWQAPNDACGATFRHHELMLAAPCHQHNDVMYGLLYDRLSRWHEILPARTPPCVPPVPRVCRHIAAHHCCTPPNTSLRCCGLSEPSSSLLWEPLESLLPVLRAEAGAPFD